MDDKKTKKYIIYSSVYFFGVISTLFFQQTFLTPLKMNEIGDYFAGLIAPLAFLWFVLAYFKQSQDVKQNAEALKMQAEELKNTVKEMQQANKIANEQKKIVMANEAHVRRGVLLQLQGLVFDSLAFQVFKILDASSESWVGRSRYERHSYDYKERYKNGDKIAAFELLIRISKNDKKWVKKVNTKKVTKILDASKKYCDVYGMLIGEILKADTADNLLEELYMGSEIGSVKKILQEALPELQGIKDTEDLNSVEGLKNSNFSKVMD